MQRLSYPGILMAVVVAVAGGARPPGRSTAEIPVQYHNGLLEVEVARLRVNPPLYFLIDSGAAANMLGAATARQLGATLCGSVLVRGVHTEASRGSNASAIPIVTRTVRLGRTEILDTPIGWHRREFFPGKTGLLGNALLSRFRLTVDAIHHRLLLEKHPQPRTEPNFTKLIKK